MKEENCKVIILISGNGSNLQAIIEASQTANFTIVAVISNKTDAYGLTRAKAVSIPTHCIEHTKFTSREAFDQAVQECIDEYKPNLVVLAGFMRILSAGFVSHYTGRLLNIHPSLLPKFPGTNTHQRALDNRESKHGAAVHFVTQELDGGPVISHAELDIKSSDTVDSLQRRVAVLEHQLYPAVVDLFANHRLKMEENSATLDGEVLPANGVNLDYLKS